MKIPVIRDIEEAAERIRGRVHRTPVLTSQSLNRLVGATLFFKCENLQRTGAFKARGATNAVLCLDDDRASRGVATHSSGNHAAALALAARERGIRAYVVMPENAPEIKRMAVESYGAIIFPCKPTLQAREAGLAAVVAETGASFIAPFNAPNVIAGQGTAALELLFEVPDLDVVITPVGGGGLLGGTAIATRSLSPRSRVLGAEPALADDARRSLAAGRIIPSDYPSTIADGLRTSLGELTFAILQEQVDDIITADEDGIVHAMRLIWERMKIVVEPSAAVPLAAILAKPPSLTGMRIGVILSGGNVDLGHLPWSRQ